MQTPVQNAMRLIVSAGLAAPDQLHGCTAKEIEELEAACGVGLPQTYKEFLSACGKEAGLFLVGSDWEYPKLPDLRRAATKLLERLKVPPFLFPDAFVFLMHQGYTFVFFDCTAGDDPPVFLFEDREPAPRQVFARFSDWLLQCAKDETDGS